MSTIVVGDFSECEVICPLSGFVSCENTEVLLDGSVSAFCLPVCLWVICCGES